MAKQQINFRANDKTVLQISELTERFNMTQAELIGHAVDMYYRHEISKTQYTVFVINQIDSNGVSNPMVAMMTAVPKTMMILARSSFPRLSRIKSGNPSIYDHSNAPLRHA